jgi:hypothetical protein
VIDDTYAAGDQPPGAAEPAEQGDAGATELCIKVAPDGSLSFYVERDGQPAEEQQAPDIGQALKMALDAYKQLQSGGDNQQAFDAGFGAEPEEQGAPNARRQGFFK